MPTTIPYTWAQARVVRSSPTTAPTPGQWYIDTSDPSYQAGVTIVYRAVPFWLALDFGYTRERKLLVLMSAPTDDGQRGRLRVYRQGAEGPAVTVTEYTELESDDVSGAALGIRGSGEVDVFYIHAGVFKHRLSQDGGVTFGSATTITLTAPSKTFTPGVATYGPGESGGQMQAVIRGGFVAFDYLAGGGIVLNIHGRLTGALDGDRPHLGRGEWDQATQAWTFGTLTNINTASWHGVPYGVQALRNGDTLSLPYGQRITKLQSDGSYTLVGTRILSGGTAQVGAADEARGQLLAFAALDGQGNGDVDGPFQTRRMMGWSWDGATNNWVFGGQAANGPPFPSAQYLKVWALRYGSFDFFTKASKLLLNRDRRWEYLFLARSEVPTIVRFEAGVRAAIAPLTWV